MLVKLTKLFQIIYPPNYVGEELNKLKEKVEKIEIDNIVNLSKSKREKIVLVIGVERNIIDFKLDPFFQIVNIDSEINHNENFDMEVINHGIENNYYSNHDTNININIMSASNVINNFSIKKVLSNFKDNSFNNSFFQSLANQFLDNEIVDEDEDLFASESDSENEDNFLDIDELLNDIEVEQSNNPFLQENQNQSLQENQNQSTENNIDNDESSDTNNNSITKKNGVYTNVTK